MFWRSRESENQNKKEREEKEKEKMREGCFNTKERYNSNDQ
jgi:hypothetical protein